MSLSKNSLTVRFAEVCAEKDKRISQLQVEIARLQAVERAAWEMSDAAFDTRVLKLDEKLHALRAALKEGSNG
jgi:uncharacterized protein involved in high-affinity Fe2+ transport